MNTEDKLAQQRTETVLRHIGELRQMAADGEINELDHNMVGGILCVHIGHLIEISDKAWETFKRFVEESRGVQARINQATGATNEKATPTTDACAPV